MGLLCIFRMANLRFLSLEGGSSSPLIGLAFVVLHGRSVELAATSSESITSDISESPVPSSVEEEEETPSAAVYSRAPEIDEDVLKRMAENRVDEVERELEALAAVHEREQRKEEEEEEDFPIDGFKLGVGEVEERSSKWACKPHEESDDEDRRRCEWMARAGTHLALRDNVTQSFLGGEVHNVMIFTWETIYKIAENSE